MMGLSCPIRIRVEPFTRYLAYGMLFVSFWGAQFCYIQLPYARLSAFRVLFALLFFGVSYIVFRRRKFLFNLKNRLIVFVLLLWLVFALFSLLWARDVVAWRRTTYFLIVGVCLCLFFPQIFTRYEHIRYALYWFLIGVVTQALIGLYEVQTGNYFFLNGATEKIEWYLRDRIPVAMGCNCNDFSTIIFVGLGAFTGFFFAGKNFFCRVFSVCFIVLGLFLIFKAHSRANQIGYLMSLLFFTYFYFRTRLEPFSFRLGICLTLVAALLLWNAFGLSFDFRDTSEGIRVNLIKNGLLFLRDTFGFGVGSGQVEYWMENFGEYQTLGTFNMHNLWMEILTNYGVIVFLGFVTIYSKLIFHFLKLSQRTAGVSALPLIFASILFGFILASVSSSSIFTSEWFWSFFALSVALVNINADGGEEANQTSPNNRSSGN